MSSIVELWQQLESWAGEHAPAMLEDLNPGAADEQLAALEETLGLRLPEDFKTSLSVHDGENDGWPSRVFADMGAYLPAERIVEHVQMHQQVARQIGIEFSDEERAEQMEEGIITVDGPVKPSFFEPGWVPILDCNGDVFWALDFSPAEGGVKGQVIRVDLECTEWSVVAPDFRRFLSDYVEALVSGGYELDDGIATKYPSDVQEDRRAEAQREAFEGAPDVRALDGLPAGDKTEIVGYRHGSVTGDRCELQISRGIVQLRGSLRGSTFNQMLRVKIRVGKRRAFGLLEGIHDILSWELLDQ